MTMHPLVKLQDIIFIMYGRALKEENRLENGTYKVYGSNGEVGLHNECLIYEPTIIIGRKGSVGKITFAEKGGWIIDTAFFIKIKNPNLVCLRYLFYALQQANLMQHTIVTSIPGISRDSILNIKIPLPALSVQKEIVAILEKADNLRKQCRQVEREINSLSQAVFLEIFGDPRSNPKGWKKCFYKDLGHVQTGNTPPRNDKNNYGDNIEWIKSDNIKEQNIYLSKSKEYLSEKGKKIGRIAHKGSVLITCIAGSSKTIGNAAIANRDVAFNQQINSITPYKDVDPIFLYGLCCAMKSIVQASTTSGMKKIITKSKFENITAFKPPLKEQVRFSKVFTSIIDLISQQQKKSIEVNKLFSTLLALAYNSDLKFGLIENKKEN